MNQIPIIVNRKSGTVIELGEEQVHKILTDACMEAGADASGVELVHPKDLEETVKNLIESGCKHLIVGGGDGTIGSAADLCADKGINLGILPLGTCNFFSRDLGIPNELAAAAISQLTSKSTRKVDVGEVNGRIFINAATLGAYPEAVSMREKARENSDTYKWSALSIQILEILKDMPMATIKSEQLSGGNWQDTPLLFVGNNHFGTGITEIGHRKVLDAGNLHAVLTDQPSYLDLARLFAKSIAGDATQAESVTSTNVDELLVETKDGEALATLDGERTHLKSPLLFKIRKQALTVPKLEV